MTGRTTRMRTVAKAKPKMSAEAKGDQRLPPQIARGVMPPMVVMLVRITGRKRLSPASSSDRYIPLPSTL